MKVNNMKVNMKKAIGACALELTLAAGCGTMAFAANNQKAEIPTEDVVAEDGNAVSYRTVFDYENDSRVVKEDSVDEAVIADSGEKWIPEGNDIIREEISYNMNSK